MIDLYLGLWEGSIAFGGRGWTTNIGLLAQSNISYDSNQLLIFANLFIPSFSFKTAWEEITALEAQVQAHGTKALATWAHEQVSLTPTSHRAYFRRRLNPRKVESYLEGIPGPRACEANARCKYT